MQADRSFPCVSFPRGATIIKEKEEPQECFYVIQSGKVLVSGKSDMYLLNGRRVLENGDIFSVEAALTNSAGHITAVAGTDVTLVAVAKKHFAAFIKQNLPANTRILRHLSAQLRYLNEKFTHSGKKAPRTAGLTRLYSFGKYYLKQNLFRSAYCAFHQYLKHCPEGKNVENARRYMNKYSSYALGIKFDYDEKDITRKYPIDSVVFFEYEPSNSMYVIRKGGIKITRIVDDKEITLAMLKPGDFIGEMGLIDSMPRSATAVASEDCEIMSISHTAYLPILKDGISITEKICLILAKRICAMYDRINEINKDRQ
jgi:CRP-like cAMP-binding protein